MDTAVRLPVVYRTDVVILGGSTQAVQAALRHAAAGRTAVLVTACAFLGTEQAMTLDYPEGTVPDERKKALEADCAAAGVRLLYQCRFVDTRPGPAGTQLVRLAGKFGLCAVETRLLEDRRITFRDRTYRALLCGREDPGQVRTLTVEVPEEEDLPSRLLHARQRILDAYRQQYAGGPFLLGRFAIRGGDPVPAGRQREQTAGLTRRAIQAHTGPAMEGRYETRPGEPVFSGTEETYDVVVAGGGTAGAMAAIAAAREGLRTVIVEPNYVLGGTGTIGGVSAYWFGSRYSDIRWLDRRVGQLHDSLCLGRRAGLWGETDYWAPDIKATVLLEAALEAGVTVRFGHMAFGVWKENGAVAGIAAAGDSGVRFFRGDYVLDATGDGDIAAFAGAAWEYGDGDGGFSYWASLAQYPTAAAYQNNFSSMAVTCDPVDYTRFTVRARGYGDGLYDHGSVPCVRESRHVRGRYRLTLRDLMLHASHPDTLYTCYSNYDPKGKVTADSVYCGYLPQQTRIEIPLGCLLPVDGQGRPLPHLYVLGKAISASHDVFPSVRMQADLLHQGSTLGALIGRCAALGARPEEMDGDARRAVLRTLSDDPLAVPAAGEMTLAESVAALSRRTRRHWVDMDFTDCETNFQPCAAVLFAPREQAVPLLEEKLAHTTDGEDRRALLRLLLWHGCSGHLEEFLGMLARDLEGDRLPPRTGPCTCAQLLPDHGVMPETVYDLDLLGWVKGDIAPPFRRVYELLLRSERDYQSLTAGIFPYIEAFAYAAARNGSPAIVDLTRRLTQLPELAEAERLPDTDLMKQRLLMLRCLLWRALAENGGEAGYQGLIGCLDSEMLPIALYAETQLCRLAGVPRGRGAAWWRSWLQNNRGALPVRLVTEKRA